MAAPPSSTVAGAAVAAQALAGVLAGLAVTLPVPTATAQEALASARRAASTLAPRLISRRDAARLAATLVTAVQTLARDASPSDASAGLYAAAAATRGCAPLSFSPALTQAYGLARAMCVGFEVACLGEAFLAEARTEFADRPASAAARARITAAVEGAIDRVAASLGQATATMLSTAAGHTCAALVTQAGTLQPLVRVSAPRSFPAAALGWSLYADPARAAELLARNACGTPFFMPSTFEALAPPSST